MDRPKEAIEQMLEDRWCVIKDWNSVLAYLDWLEGKHVVEWPAELTRERLEKLADGEMHQEDRMIAIHAALRALAAIAPQKKKRVAELWIHERGQKEWLYSDDKWTAQRANMPGWKCLARNIELED